MSSTPAPAAAPSAPLVLTIELASLDTATVRDFRGAVLPKLAGQSRVLLDLGQVTFVDSTGLGALMTCLRQLHQQNGDLRLCRVAPQVRSLFQLVRLDRIVGIFATPEEALADWTV